MGLKVGVRVNFPVELNRTGLTDVKYEIVKCLVDGTLSSFKVATVAAEITTGTFEGAYLAFFTPDATAYYFWVARSTATGLFTGGVIPVEVGEEKDIEDKIDTADALIDAIIADIGVFPSANYATLAAYVEDIRTRLIAIVADTGAITWGDITTILALVDSAESAGPYSYLDAGGEQDIYEDTAVTRRRIWFEVSNRNMTQTGTFRIYRMVNGANYDLYIEQAVLIAAGEDRAWDAEFTVNQHWKITYEEDVNEAANRDIPYNVIMQVIE